MGSGTGGFATLYAVSKGTSIKERKSHFRAAVAFYPLCDVQDFVPEAPVLILMGEHSGWAPVEKCKALVDVGENDQEMTLKVYPGVYYFFDFKEAEKSNVHGIIQKYDPEATANAIKLVKGFFAKHLQ